MKIVLVCKVYPTSRPGGMGFVCQDRARELVKQGHEVHVITTCRKESGTPEFLVDEGIHVFHATGEPGNYSRTFAAGCAEAVRGIKPDILHLDSFDNKHPWWRDVKVNCRLGLTMHGFCWGGFFTNLNLHMRDGLPSHKAPALNSVGIMHERGYMLDFDRVIGISIHEHWMLHQLMGLYDAKMIYNPIPDYFYDQPKQPIRSKKFVCVAVSGHEERGFKYALRAAQKAGVNLEVIRGVPRQEIPAVLDASCGLVLPTAYAQGLDLSVGEAIARQRPVIVTATGSYLREAYGAYKGALRLVPLIEPVDELAANMSDWVQYVNWDGIRQVHRAANHVRNWLEVMQ